MASIFLETFIKAPRERVFDLARNIDLHKLSTAKTNEEAIAGKKSGLLELHETVTWRARHLGFYQTLTSKMVALESPIYFTDEMVKGIFSYMKHRHEFKESDDGTLMIDIFEFRSPLGLLGKLMDALFLKRYLTKLLIHRNDTIKRIAESEEWKHFLTIK